MHKLHLIPKILLQGFYLPFSSAYQPHQGHLHEASCYRTNSRHLTGRRWKGEQQIKWCFQPLPPAELCSFTAPGLEQVQGTRLQTQAEQMIYWRGAATAAEMGTVAAVGYVTSPLLGQGARLSSSTERGIFSKPAPTAWAPTGLQHNPTSLSSRASTASQYRARKDPGHS